MLRPMASPAPILAVRDHEMNSNLQLLRNSINNHQILGKEGFNFEFLDRSERYPNSELMRFKADKFAGELSIYELESNYCEYELLIFDTEQFYSRNEEFADKKDLANVLTKFLDEINEITGP